MRLVLVYCGRFRQNIKTSQHSRTRFESWSYCRWLLDEQKVEFCYLCGVVVEVSGMVFQLHNFWQGLSELVILVDIFLRPTALHAERLEGRIFRRPWKFSTARSCGVRDHPQQLWHYIAALIRYTPHSHDVTRTNERRSYAMTSLSRSEQLLPWYGEHCNSFLWPMLASLPKWVGLNRRTCAQCTLRTLELFFLPILANFLSGYA